VSIKPFELLSARIETDANRQSGLGDGLEQQGVDDDRL
jgi:hypothetical protein